MKNIIEKVLNKKISVSKHAIARLHERQIEIDHIVEVITEGEIIEEYPTDYPYPSCLILGYYKSRPIHIVCSDSEPVYIITAYEPNIEKWHEDYKQRR